MAISLVDGRLAHELVPTRISREPYYRLVVDNLQTEDVELSLGNDDTARLFTNLAKVFARPVENSQPLDPSETVGSKYWRQSPEWYQVGIEPGFLRFRAFLPGYNYATKLGDKGSDCVVGFSQIKMGMDPVFLAEWHALHLRRRSFMIFDPKLRRLAVYEELGERGIQHSLFDGPGTMPAGEVEGEIGDFESIVESVADARRGNNRYNPGMRGGFRLIHPLFA